MYSYFLEYDDYILAKEEIKNIYFNYKDYEEINIDLDEDSIYNLVDEVTTISLFDNLKFVVVKNANLMSICDSNDAKDSLVRAVSDPDNLNVVIFLFDISDRKNINKDNKLYKSLLKLSSLKTIESKDKSMDTYALESFQKDGFKIDKEALTLLVKNSLNLEFLLTNIEKLKCYKYDEKSINSNDVLLLVNRSLDSKTFELTNAIIDHDKKRIFEIYQDLKEQSIDASTLVATILTNFQNLYDILVLSKSRVSQDEIASLFHISSGRAYHLILNAKAFTLDDIMKNLDLLNDLDFNIKQGLIDKNVGLELYLLR